jgi:hypothetical protein
MLLLKAANKFIERPFVAGDCRLPGFGERLLTRKLSLNQDLWASASDPKQTANRPEISTSSQSVNEVRQICASRR